MTRKPQISDGAQETLDEQLADYLADHKAETDPENTCSYCKEYHPHEYLPDLRGRCQCDCCWPMRKR